MGVVGTGEIRGGIIFSASKLRGAKFQCKQNEAGKNIGHDDQGGAKFECEQFSISARTPHP